MITKIKKGGWNIKIKHYLLAVISLVLFQGCLCKHYPFEKLKSEVGEPLHKQIMEYKKANGTYPDKKIKKFLEIFLKIWDVNMNQEKILILMVFGNVIKINIVFFLHIQLKQIKVIFVGSHLD